MMNQSDATRDASAIKSGTENPRVEFRQDELIPAATHLDNVCAHYRDTIDNYRWWSPEGHLHFGYWRWGVNPFSRRAMLEEMNNLVFQHLRLAQLECGSIADLGCGVGAASRFGSRRFPKLNWHAVNISSRQIADANRLNQSERIEYHRLNYHRLPWKGCSLDGAFFMESLCYSVQPHDVIAEVSRVLHPGARLVITDGFLTRPLSQTSRLFRAIFECVASNWAVPCYHQINQVEKWLQPAGLKCVLMQELGWRLAPTALQSVPLTVVCALKLIALRERNLWRWRQLAACGLSLLLGLQRRNFRYYVVVLEKLSQTHNIDHQNDHYASPPNPRGDDLVQIRSPLV